MSKHEAAFFIVLTQIETNELTCITYQNKGMFDTQEEAQNVLNAIVSDGDYTAAEMRIIKLYKISNTKK